MKRSTQRRWVPIVVALAVVAAAASPARAQSTMPSVSTGAVADRAATSATLLGRVAPNGARTTYHFQYGPTKRYGAVTPSAVAAGNAAAANVTASLSGLAPNTTYHYRLVATNRNGTRRGRDRTFRTRRQPLGLALAALPNPVALGRPAVLAGRLSGTGNGGRQILLQANPFPYTQGFAQAANVQLADDEGRFAFPLLAIPRNTQFRVLIPGKPEVVSPIVAVGVKVRVGTYASAKRVRTGRYVRFFGTIRPARPGARFAVQVLRAGAWRTVAGGVARGHARGVSRYAKRVRIRRGGRYRVFVAVTDGEFASGGGRSIRIRRSFSAR